LDSDGDGIGDACDLCPFDPLNDIDGDSVCGDIDTCPFTYNPDQLEKSQEECDNIIIEYEEYDEEIMTITTEEDIQFLIENSYGRIGQITPKDLKENSEKLKQFIKVEKKEYYKGEKLFTKYRITVETETPIKNFVYYQIIPKCLAEKAENIYFNGKNYHIIERDPIIAWQFAEVKNKVEMIYEVEGSVSESCLEELKDLIMASSFNYDPLKTRDLKKIVIPILASIILIFLVIFFEKEIFRHEKEDKFDEIIKHKADEIREKYKGYDKKQIKQILENQGISKNYTKEILKKL
jgi:hypothetical protein